MSGFSFCLILLLPICTRAQDLPECAIPHTTAAITIDGRLNETAWAETSVIDEFSFPWWTAGAKDRTEVFDNIHNADRENPAAFWQDDAWEVEVNPDHTPTEEHNLEGEPANNFSYKWAVPPVEGSYQYYRPVSALEWLVDGSEWVSFGWGFDGEQFGESTYRYELAITPITSLPNDASATADQAVVFDLGENEIIHTSITVGDFDEACTECVLESYQGFWTMSPEMCCTGTNDVVLAEMEPSLLEKASTAVDIVSWGQIKAAY